LGVGWYSYPLRLSDLFAAWRAGNATWFGAARANTRSLGRELPLLLGVAQTVPISFACHSTGCTAVLDFLQNNPNANVERIILFAGSYEPRAAARIAERSSARFLNVIVPEDGASRLDDFRRHLAGEDGNIGVRGLPKTLSNWTDLRLSVGRSGGCEKDDATTNDPHRFLNHVAAYECRNLWQSYRKFMDE
jgi:hypothetical protein